MKVAFRVDASRRIGTGHVMRCLTLAELLRADGAQVGFVCRELDGNLIGSVHAKGFDVARLPAPTEGWVPEAPEIEHEAWLELPWRRDAEETATLLDGVDWLVADHYAIDHRWETVLRPRCHHLMLIDDLADRRHDCDLLLDQNFYDGLESRYHGLVPDGCQLCLGPRFNLLREEFERHRGKVERRPGPVAEILVFFGGADADDLTGRTLSALRAAGPAAHVTAILGRTNPHRERLAREYVGEPWLTLHEHVDDMARLMAAADLAIGGGGTTTWERCVMGLPSITVAIARNQAQALDDLDRYGAVWHLGWHDDVTEAALAAAVEWAAANPEARLEVGRRAAALMGDLGGTAAVAGVLWARYAP